MLHLSLAVASTRPTWPDILVFAASAAVIIVGALGVVTSRNPVHAALSLVMTLFGVAVLFIEQEADFLAAVQIIVYAGAIVVLFLFVIMFLGVDRREDITTEPLHGQRPLAFLMLAITAAGVIAMVATSHWVTGAHQVVGPIEGPVTGAAGAPSGEVAQLGKQLFTTYLFAFEATAALLVIAVVGAVVLARRPGIMRPTDELPPEPLSEPSGAVPYGAAPGGGPARPGTADDPAAAGAAAAQDISTQEAAR
jgi:NADH-quinone oxidoreductase subunit J